MVGAAVLLRNRTETTCDSPTNFPKPGEMLRISEPYVRASIVTPEKYLGAVITLCSEHRGEQLEMTFIDETRVILRYDLPLSETVATNFYDQLKSLSHGYASFDYDEGEYRESKIVLVLPPLSHAGTHSHTSHTYTCARTSHG